MMTNPPPTFDHTPIEDMTADAARSAGAACIVRFDSPGAFAHMEVRYHGAWLILRAEHYPDPETPSRDSLDEAVAAALATASRRGATGAWSRYCAASSTGWLQVACRRAQSEREITEGGAS